MIVIFGLCGATVTVAMYSIAYLLVVQTWSKHGVAPSGYGLNSLISRAGGLGIMWLVYLVPAAVTGLVASATKQMPAVRWIFTCIVAGAVTSAITNLFYQQDLAAALQSAACGIAGALAAVALTVGLRNR